MEYRELLMDSCIESGFHTKAPRKTQRHKEPLCAFVSSLCFCVKLLLALTFLVSTCLAQPRLPMRPADIVKVSNVTDAQISPNGQSVVYTVSSVDEDKNLSTLWLARSDIRTPPRPLLPSGWTASNPRWSPDSNSIAFLSTHEDQDGLWVLKLDKTEPRFIAPITTTNFFITYAGESLSWSPDSRRIAYISAKAEAAETTDPRVIDRIQYKSRTSLSDNRRTHVWVVEVDRPVSDRKSTRLNSSHIPLS